MKSNQILAKNGRTQAGAKLESAAGEGKKKEQRGRGRTMYSRLTPAEAAKLPDGDYQVRSVRIADLTEDNYRDISKDAKTVAILRDSIAREGILQPVQISLTLDEDGSPRFLLADGHNRKNISEGLGKTDLPAIVTVKKGMNQQEHNIRAVMSNMARNELLPIEVALAYRRLIDAGLKTEELAEVVRVDVAYVRKVLRVTELEPEVLEAVRAAPKDYPMRKLITLTQEGKGRGKKAAKRPKAVDGLQRKEAESRLKAAGYESDEVMKILQIIYLK